MGPRLGLLFKLSVLFGVKVQKLRFKSLAPLSEGSGSAHKSLQP